MKTGESLLSIGKFIAEYSAHLMGAGVHTSRVVRNTKRIGEAFGCLLYTSDAADEEDRGGRGGRRDIKKKKKEM